MKKIKFAIAIGALSHFVACKAPVQSYRFSEISNITSTTLYSGTAINLTPSNTTLIKDVSAQKSLYFKTSSPLVVDGKTVIPINSKAKGTILKVESKGMNAADIVSIRLDYVVAADGQEIALKAPNFDLKVNLHDINAQLLDPSKPLKAYTAYDNLIKF
jgi:hypothetical protein